MCKMYPVRTTYHRLDDSRKTIGYAAIPGSNRGPFACEANVITNYTMAACMIAVY